VRNFKANFQLHSPTNAQNIVLWTVNNF